ncbi:MAG: tRNA (adenosine(37)-N6)-threonylcarbamoyltransferase complex dimerization subunit type 1 TsaB, partial [Desulfocapsaceae bacterium]|nr:tRNA (adenosine(37)-N6)-threonylcarbamoyltransferase complex dimerization subunit type 1 TsaB [Desulfocapsaceae bacterium]
MAGDTLILAFDTATPQCSVALTSGGVKDGTVVALQSLGSGVTHSRRLLSSIEQLVVQSSLETGDLTAIAVGLGPG